MSLSPTVSKPWLHKQPSTKRQRGGKSPRRRANSMGSWDSQRREPDLSALAGMDDHVTWGSQGRGPKSPAGESIHKWHLSYTDSIAFLMMSWQISSNLPPEPQEWRGSSFLPLPKQFLTSLTHELQYSFM